MEKYNPVGWFEIYVQNMDRAKKFYEKVLNVKLENLQNPTNDDDDFKMMAFPMTMERIPGASGALVQMKGVPSGGNSTLVYFTSENCATEEARVEAAGGKIFKPKMSIGEYGFISLCVDTEGNMFGVHSNN